MMENLQLSDSLFTAFAKHAHKLSGITIKSQRKVMLEGRLRRRLRALELENFDDYLTYIKRHQNEHQFFINAITTNETYFYRTPRVWEYISDTFLPDWLNKNSGNTLKAWSAASSTGEEAHTLGIIFENFNSHNAGFKYEIMGTDIDSNVVNTAKQGLYKGRSIKRFRQARPDLFDKYMTGDDESGYKVVSPIKNRIRFCLSNLFEQPNESPLDLVLIRNVLIYFERNDQINAMSQVYRRLKNDGIVIIGESETLNNLYSEFQPVMPTIYGKSDAASRRNAA